MKKLLSSLVICVLALNLAPVFAADGTDDEALRPDYGKEYLEAKEKMEKDTQKKALQEKISAKRAEIAQTKNANHMTLRQKDAKVQQLTRELQDLKKQLNSL